METYDASIGGEKGLLYVGCEGVQAAPAGEAGDDDDEDEVGSVSGGADGGKGEGGGEGGETSGGGSDKGDDDDANDDLDTGIQFVSAKDSSVLLAFDVSRLLACDAKGRYRMVLTYIDDDGGSGDGGDAADGEKKLAVVRVHGTAVDRVIGAVLDLAEEASSRAAVDGGRAAADESDRTNERLPAFAADSAYAPAGVQGAPTGPEDPLSATTIVDRATSTQSTHGGFTPTTPSDPGPKEV